MIGNDDDAVFFEGDDFADAFTYVSQAHGNFSRHGIFTAAQAAIAQGDYPGVASVGPILTIGINTLPNPAKTGDTATIRGVTYRVADIQPDGSGLIRLILERI